MEKAEKLSWWKQFEIACFKPRQYKKLLSVGKGRLICFFTLISFLITFLGFGMDLFAFSASVGGTKNFIRNRLPAFELRNGELTIDETMDFTIAGCRVAADTKKNQVDMNELNDKYDIELIFAKKEMVIKNNTLQQITSKISFQEHKDVVFNNQTMVSLIPMIYFIAIAAFGFTWIANIIKYLFFCAFISFLTYMNQKVREDGVTFGEIFQLSIYARVPFQLIETIGITAGIGMFSGTVWMLISYLGSYQLLVMGFIRPEMPKTE